MALWFERAMLPSGWADRVRVTLAEGRVVTVAADAAFEAEDERHALALPGLPNVHSHGFQRGMAGLSERRGRPDDDFWSWREVMYRFLDRLTPDDIAAITAQAYAEMLETGFTHVGEFHYLHNDVDGGRYADPAETAASIVAAADATGIGLTLLPVFYAHSDFGGAPPAPGQRRFVSAIDGFARLVEASAAKLSGDMNLGIAPHSLRAATGEQIRAIRPLAGDGPVHIHAAEQGREVAASIAHSGARPVEWLLGEIGLDERWCLIHATHVTDAECDALAASGAVAGLCPVTEANLGDGVFPAERFLAAGGRIGVGTDSNICVDAAGEIRMLEYAQRLTQRRRAVLADDGEPSVGTALFGRALAGGSQALSAAGGIAVGNSADIVSLTESIDHWIFASRRGAIDCVWRAGVKQVAGGRHVAGEAIETRYRAVVARLTA